jgi:hypothetical protein
MQQQQAQAQAQHQGYSQGQEYAEMMHRAELMQLQNGGYADDQGGYDINYVRQTTFPCFPLTSEFV